MPRGDAVQERPTIEQEIATFKSFTTVDGELSNETETPEEKTAAENKAAADAQATKVAAASEAKTEAGPVEPKTDAVEKTEEDPNKGKAKQGRSTSERIGELTRNWRQAQRDAETKDATIRDLQARLERVEKGELTPPKDGSKTQRSDTDAPDPKDYEYGELDVRYIEDRTRHAVRQELKADRDRASQNQQRDADARKAQELAERKTALAEKGAAKYPDFEEVVIEGAEDGLWPLSRTMGELIFESDVGHEIAYHLASNPKEARRVAGLTDTQQAAYFGRLEARFSSPADAKTEAKQPPVKVPKAPPPPEHQARGGSGSAASANPNDFAAWEREAMASLR